MLPLDGLLGLDFMGKRCDMCRCINAQKSTWDKYNKHYVYKCVLSILVVSGVCTHDPCTPVMVLMPPSSLAQNGIAPLIDTLI